MKIVMLFPPVMARGGGFATTRARTSRIESLSKTTRHCRTSADMMNITTDCVHPVIKNLPISPTSFDTRWVSFNKNVLLTFI